MSLTYSTLTQQFVNGDGTSGSGELSFRLNKSLTNGGITIAGGTRVTTQLDASGNVRQTLASNIDAGSFPPDTLWLVEERVLGSSPRSYEVQVPSGGVSVPLGTLQPGLTPPAFG